MSGDAIVVYDIEFLGNLEEGVGHCRVYEIGAVNVRGDEFHTLVDPGEPYVQPHVGVLPPVESLRSAPSLQEAVDALMQWAPECPVLVSHGNFRSDQLVLRRARFPPGVLFGDSLMIARSMLRVPAYSLSALHVHFGLGTLDSPHNALADARALFHVLHAMHVQCDIRLHMCLYNAHEYALSNYAGIGAKTELALARLGFVLGDPSTWHVVALLHSPARLCVQTLCDGQSRKCKP
jgi:DNA polymerase III epsilon subunit-like protein